MGALGFQQRMAQEVTLVSLYPRVAPPVLTRSSQFPRPSHPSTLSAILPLSFRLFPNFMSMFVISNFT